MRKDSVAFLLAGFAIGFAVLYFWTKQRAPQIVAAFPILRSEQQQGPGGPPVPPVDMARVQMLRDRIQSNPKDFDALVELGNIDFDQRNFSTASGWYSKALELQPDNVNVRIDMATTMFYSENFDGAIEEFKKALAINPTHPQALFNIGVAYLHGKNDSRSALEWWERLVATNPNDPQLAMVKEQIAAVKAQLGGPPPGPPRQ
jgi:cytochrome c-type biogenesis protein CcmH/NrfG